MTEYHVFLSHNSTDKPTVKELARRLVKAGIQPWLDTWNLVPGEPWQEAIEEALDACQTVTVFLGPAGIGTWENEEMRSALEERVRDKSRRVIPVLLSGAPDLREKPLPRFLRRMTWVDFRGGLDDENAFQRLVAGIRGVAPGPGMGPPVRSAPRPPRPTPLPARPVPRYHDFELHIGDPRRGRYPVRVVDSPAGEGEATFRLPFSADELATLLASLEKGDTDAALLDDTGERLFAALFTGDVHTRYVESVGRAGDDDGLRLRLRLDPPELHALPWELLRDPEKREVLALSKRALIVRYLPVPRPTPPLVVEPPLRILVATASPAGSATLDVEGELAAIKEAVQSLGDGVRIIPLPHATRWALRQRLIDDAPHVLHFAGHGDFDGQEGTLVLEDERRRAERLPGTMLATLLKGASVRLAVLNACLSAVDATVVEDRHRQRAAMLGVGPALVNAGLGAVVGMGFSLPDASGRVFARDFYEMLARLLPVDVCMSRAREALLLEAGRDSRDWAAPALFLRAPDGVLFRSETGCIP
jgi:hypothetical protein